MIDIPVLIMSGVQGVSSIMQQTRVSTERHVDDKCAEKAVVVEEGASH